MAKRLLGIIGSLPQPVGGVTSFLERFVNRCVAPDIFIDYVFSKQKPIICDNEMRFFVSKNVFGAAAKFILFEVFRVFVKREKITWFINFSTPVGVLRCALLPKCSGASWVLMLHNGELGAVIGDNFLAKLLFRMVYKKFDRVLVLSDLQYSYYKNYFRDGQLIRVKSYIRIQDYGLFWSARFRALSDLKHATQYPVVTVSGYPLADYGYRLFFDSIGRLSNKNLIICICTYGDGPERVADLIPTSVSDRVHHFHNLSEHAFVQILRLSDIYVRPNLVDSFGVAVADAVALGKVVIASDVCERCPGPLLFGAGDAEALCFRLTNALKDLSGSRSDMGAFDGFVNANEAKLKEVFSADYWECVE